MEKRYLNRYEMTENYVLLHIFGMKHQATLVIEKEDYSLVSSVNWGLMEVGKVGWKKLIPYTVVHRTCIPLARWLLGVDEKGMRVEHRDRNNLNFLRQNMYVIGKHDAKQQASKRNGVYEVKQKKGNVTGYRVDYRNEQGKIQGKYFSVSKYGGLDHAKREAELFNQSVHLAIRHSA